MSFIEDLFANGRPAGCAPMNDDQAEKSYPLLYEALNQRAYADGTPVTSPTVVIRRIPGGIEIVLQCHDFDMQKVATAKRLADCWRALEKALGDPESPWKQYSSKLPSELKKKAAKKKA